MIPKDFIFIYSKIPFLNAYIITSLKARRITGMLGPKHHCPLFPKSVRWWYTQPLASPLAQRMKDDVQKTSSRLVHNGAWWWPAQPCWVLSSQDLQLGTLLSLALIFLHTPPSSSSGCRLTAASSYLVSHKAAVTQSLPAVCSHFFVWLPLIRHDYPLQSSRNTTASVQCCLWLPSSSVCLYF